MIERQWRQSVPGRSAAALSRSYAGSLLCGLMCHIKNSYPGSRLCDVLSRWASHSDRSLYGALLDALNGMVFALGRRFSPLWRTSLTGALCRSVAGLPLWRSGYVMTALRRLGVRRLLLLAFALYLPLDWLLRLPVMPSFLGPLWHNALLLGCVLYVIWQRATERLPGHYTPVDAPMLLFFGLCVFLLFYNSIDFMIGFTGMRATMQYLIWFLVLTRMIRDRRDWHLVYTVMALVGAAVALHGIYQYIVATPIPSHWVTHSEMGVRTRVFSITGSPNIMGDLMVMLMPLSVAMAYRKGISWERRLVWWALAAIQGLSCIFTFSRGSWVGLAVAALVFILFQDRRLSIALLAVAAVAIFIPEIMNRLAFLMTEDFVVASQFGGRAGRREIGLALLRGAGYLFGMGHGRYGGAVAMQNPIVEWLTYHYLDNYYLKTLVETGIAGLTSYLMLIAATMAAMLRSVIRAKGSLVRPQLVAIMAAMAGVLVHCLFENIFEVPYMSSYFWGMAALSCASVRLEKNFLTDAYLPPIMKVEGRP